MIGACHAPPPPVAPTVPVASPRPAPTAISRPDPNAAGASTVDPKTIAIVRRTRHFGVGGGWETSAAWAALEPVLPAVDDCYKQLLARSVDRRGPLNLHVTLEKKGLEAQVTGPFDDAFTTCVKDALKKIAPPPVVSPGGTPTLRLESDVYPAAIAPELRAPRKGATVVKAPDGSCAEMLHADCPPNKVCDADEHKPVRCVP